MRHRIAGVDFLRFAPAADALQFRRADAVVGDIGNFTIHQFHQFAGIGAGGRQAGHDKQRGFAAEQIVVHADAQRFFFAAYQVFIEAAGRVAAEDVAQHIERIRGFVVQFAQSGYLPGQSEQGLGSQCFADALCRLAAAVFQRVARRFGGFGQAAELLLDLFQGCFGIDIADNNQHGIIGRIPAAVPTAQIISGETVEIGAVADDGRAQVGQAVGGQVEVFPQLAAGIIFAPHPPLFFDHIHFIGKVAVAEIQIGHAIGFQFQHFGQIAHGDIGYVHGGIARGIGVVLPAQGRNAARKFAGGNSMGSFEHHVFQRVAQAGFACLFVYAADAVPQARYRYRRAAVFFDDNGHAIGQRVLERFGRKRGGEEGGECQ